MNDDEIEKLLRQMPAPELPASWQGEILAMARRATGLEWPPLVLILRNLLARNPFSATVLATLWLLILLFRFTTPVDTEVIAHSHAHKPVYFLTQADEIRLVELAMAGPAKPGPMQ